MPSKKRKDGTFKDIAHPLNKDTREMMEQKILQAYDEELKKPKSAQGQDPDKD